MRVADAISLFIAYAKDAANWNGTPLLGGNIELGTAESMQMVYLLHHDLITTFNDDGHVWVAFTESGKRLAAEMGITIN
jgi:hypothetical protein